MDPTSVDREVKAVDSEFEQDIQCDTTRVYQLEKSLSASDHPYNNFFGGKCEFEFGVKG